MKFARTQNIEAFKPLVVAAEGLLSQHYSDRISIAKIERLTEPGRRNLLLRCFIEPVHGLPASFMLKKVEGKYDPNNAELWDTKRFFNDWVGSQFLNTIPSKVKHSPRFYGGDRQLGMIVLEDVQHRNSLVEPLLGSNRDRAEWALFEYASCLGHLHNDTLGLAKEYSNFYQKLSLQDKLPSISLNIPKYKSTLENLGIQVENDYLQDLEVINQASNNRDRFFAYIHTDACPDNVLDTGSELRPIDFETGCFGYIFFDLVFARMMFPSCWCSKRIPDTVVRQMEATYRAILLQNCPAIEDDRLFNRGIVSACGKWLLDTLMSVEFVLERDRDFGISTIRQRILARLSAFIATSQDFDLVPGLRSTSSRLLDLLGQRWSDVSDLPLYPAFERKF